ncbi:MAG TPA: hypothetical protein VGM88_12730 [Kofleriaceae bacterium]|jgi:hypothetical protein
MLKADRVDAGASVGLRVVVFKKPDALVFNEPHSSDLTAFVCRRCGFTDLYADNVAVLNR